jgi:hypothetical protein
LPPLTTGSWSWKTKKQKNKKQKKRIPALAAPLRACYDQTVNDNPTSTIFYTTIDSLHPALFFFFFFISSFIIAIILILMDIGHSSSGSGRGSGHCENEKKK